MSVCPKCAGQLVPGTQHCNSPHCPWRKCPECKSAIDRSGRVLAKEAPAAPEERS